MGIENCDWEPAYRRLWASGELHRRVEAAREALRECVLCGRQCRADRLHESAGWGFCRTGRHALVANHFPHHGEERCISGTRGSGTIFFANCNLRCVFCQNFDISWFPGGLPVDAERLARIMLELQEQGCHNINLVSPSHVIPQILEAVEIAAGEGLHLPLVYNSGGYDSPAGLELLDGVIDIYMPDIKFVDREVAHMLAAAEDYWDVCRRAVSIMHRQVGDLVLDLEGIARRGLLIRHLVLPGDKAGTRTVMEFLAREISPNTYVNVMPQYRPEGRAGEVEGMSRRVRREEYLQAMEAARNAGLKRLCLR
ncbi:MAG: radical SAM protein [Planctomycetota bacterium]|nr:MAG: radical SAM protein [Planctomycetota bacterium]